MMTYLIIDLIHSMIYFYDSSSEDDIFDVDIFDEAILNAISSVVADMFDDSCTTSSCSATSSDFVTIV